MFISDADIEERMVSFDCIVKIVVRSKEMCTSAPMLDFLGFDLTADKKYYKVVVIKLHCGLMLLIAAGQSENIRLANGCILE